MGAPKQLLHRMRLRRLRELDVGHCAPMTSKRLPLIALSALLLIIVALQIATPGDRRYRADSMVVVKPYTNAFFARSFESHIIQTIPGVLALRVTPPGTCFLAA